MCILETYLGFKCIHSCFELMHSLFKEFAWSSHVESHVAVARHAINLAIVERKMSIVGKELHQL